jgi:phage tail-like protein
MNANQQRFWMVADDRQWRRSQDPPALRWDGGRRVLRLAGQRKLPISDSDLPESEGERGRSTPRQAIDRYGSRAFLDADGKLRAATADLPDDAVLFELEPDQVTDLALGHDGILYAAVSGGVELYDPRQRWQRTPIRLDGFEARRLAPRAAGGVWVLDGANRLGMVRGLPLPDRPPAGYDAATWRPGEENPDPPRLHLSFGFNLDQGEEQAAFGSGPGGRVGLLTWTPDGASRLRLLRAGGRAFSPPWALLRAPGDPLRYAYSLAWISEERVAVIVPGLGEAPTFEIPDEDVATLLPCGDLYPLRGHAGGPFLNGPVVPPHYPTPAGSAPLHKLSFPSYALSGQASNLELLDSGSTGTEWHRLYLEACLPPRCGIRVDLAATDAPAAPEEGWHEHRFGHVPGENGRGPRAAWVPLPSELPFHPGLLPCPPERDQAGLFTCLIQRAGRRVSALTGRYLWIRIEMSGDGRSTPELAAVRAWGPRFSYADRYLPELYREDLLGPEADEKGQSTPADFLERFLGSFEGVLTALEDRIASSYLLTDARTVPEDALEWLGSWIAMAFEPGHPPARRRRLLQAAPELYRWRGTLRGFRMALDLATGGAVEGGEVVVLEEFRLRRTFATILGIDLAREEDPLLGGLSISGNSYVGDTLFLGDERRKEFLALFGASLPRTAAEEQAVAAFFEGLAHRVTVLVHQEVEPQDLGLVRRIAETEAPAHVRVRVITASRPFIVGLASLVGVETYLGRPPGLTPVRVSHSVLGTRDHLIGSGSLDPRLDGGV